ncbi:hypothetical protein BKA70DRAFT_439562 [Coprinopsis sp. MPI-PUGE-AT-0042]|nr:hypothetical protein BKA70DRAFT_439562 [Coprinopsis sp. MPI-PUGE-AT-0042]
MPVSGEGPYITKFSSSTHAQLLAKTINPAKRGDMMGLYSLQMIAQSSHGPKLVVSLLEIYLTHLDSHLIPASAQIDARNEESIRIAERGLMSLYGISRTLQEASKNSGTRGYPIPSIVSKVGDKLDDIVAWFTFAISRSPESYVNETMLKRPNCNFILYATWLVQRFMDLGKEGLRVASQSEAIGDLLVRLWVLKIKDVECPFFLEEAEDSSYFVSPPIGSDALVEWEPDVGCFLLAAFRDIVLDKGVGTQFMRRFFAYLRDTAVHGSQIDPFVVFSKTVLSRLSVINHFIDSGGYYTQLAWYNLEALGVIVRYQTSEDLKLEPGIARKLRETLHRADFSATFSAVICKISEKAYAEERMRRFPPRPVSSPALPLSCMKLEAELVLMEQIERAYSTIPTYRALMDAGLLRILGNTAALLHQYPQRYRDALDSEYFIMSRNTIRVLLGCAIAFPTLARSILRGYKELHSEARAGLNWVMTQNGFSEPQFLAVLQLYDQWFQAHTKVWDVMICDNGLHHDREDLPKMKKGKQVQQCSGCLAKVYCDRNCQKQDWKLHHKVECPKLRMLSIPFKQAENLYHHRYRSWHHQFVKHFYNQVKPFERVHLKRPPSIIIRVDTREFPVEIATSNIENYEIEPSAIKELDDRLRKDFIPWAMARKPIEKVDKEEKKIMITRLLEGYFVMGRVEIIVTFKARITKWAEAEEVEIEVLDSITRTITNRELPDKLMLRPDPGQQFRSGH